MNKEVIRESNFELLRIMAILMIISLHYLNFGGALSIHDIGSKHYYISHLLESFFIIAVNLFVLITGYFNVNTKKVKISKLLQLPFLGYLYGTIFLILSIILEIDRISFKSIIKYVQPFLDGGYWFIKIYIILQVISPFLNILLNTLTKKSYQVLLGIMIIFFSLWPSFALFPPNNDAGYGIISFSILYSIGYYLKKHYKVDRIKWVYLTFYILCMLGTYLWNILQPIVRLDTAWMYNFPLNILGAVFLFLFFSRVNTKSKVINYISTYTFPIYLIHFNPFIIELVFKRILRCQDFWFSKYFIAHLIISVVTLYSMSFGIEFIRKLIFKAVKKTLNMITNNKMSLTYKKICRWIDDLIDVNETNKNNRDLNSKFLKSDNLIEGTGMR